ncbi:hypothetical protein [Actinomyces bowdenii]|nr:hypothetical protein [Actinomyces bowdenii]
MLNLLTVVTGAVGAALMPREFEKLAEQGPTDREVARARVLVGFRA